MHGLVFAELEKFVTRAHGADTWRQVVSKSGVSSQVFVALGTYPDADLMNLVQAATVVTKTPMTPLLEGFGEFITPTLFSMYRSVIAPGWRTLDLVENTESVIHAVVRTRGGTPPVLSVTRQSPTLLVVSYGSKRKMCALARGIILGIARHYGENVGINETACMLLGAKACQLELSLAAPPTVKMA
jgi:hypothetical protein